MGLSGVLGVLNKAALETALAGVTLVADARNLRGQSDTTEMMRQTTRERATPPNPTPPHHNPTHRNPTHPAHPNPSPSTFGGPYDWKRARWLATDRGT